ncbi:protein gamma response 1 [Actinidia rufa]|uniref:Protein gamma response 1 n=1 Tax=Actinidia rufa TaxID=165716 RepID=A0A7J0FP08_9ERIC|nr:protein gamma response 1 [Actinidia rufa]
MERNLQKLPQLGYPIDDGDAKYVSGLSTILVATIQEAKDRISQIEYIFCSQLFPNFQSKSKSLKKIYSEARTAAEDAWKEKEKDLLLEIEKLQNEKKLILDENQSLNLEKTMFVNCEDPFPNKIYELQEVLKQKTREATEGRETQLNLLKALETKASVMVKNEQILKELEEKNNLLLKKQRSLELEAERIRGELLKKSKEVDEGMELQNKLLQLVQSETTSIVHKEKQLKEQEEKTNELLTKLESLERNFDMIQEQLSSKTDEVDKAKELREKLLKEIELHRVKNANNEHLLNNYETEKTFLTDKVLSLEESVDGLQKELRKKLEEVEEGRKLQEQLIQQIDSNNSEMLKIGQQSEELAKEKKLHLAKIKGLEEKVDKLHVDLRERSNETSEGMELHGKLLRQIEAKDSELLSEKKKRKDVIAAYKSLKSQYNFLREKFGLTTESTLPQNKIEDESDSLRHNQHLLTSPDNRIIAPNVLMVACEITKEKENLEEDKRVGLIQRSKSESPSISNSVFAPNCPHDVKSAPLAGTKRPISSWRGTRSHEHRGGPDPHDDFLDTPLENIRANAKKPTKEEVHDLPGPVPMDMNFDSSDDETQDMNGDPGPQKPRMLVPRSATSGFKYVEPVRKKAERENLKGIECKQCKKFYDAVLPDGGGKDADGNKQQARCEHHDGVSRHRYRYAPPLTPEGFWNIGFESEM